MISGALESCIFYCLTEGLRHLMEFFVACVRDFEVSLDRDNPV
jgi:hypothetical protein